MPIPRPRLTVRRLMIVVAVAALLLGVGVGLKRRRDRLRSLAELHDRAWVEKYSGRLGPSVLKEAIDLWHFEMARKYEQAASRPWLPVPPDPPEPE